MPTKGLRNEIILKLCLRYKPCHMGPCHHSTAFPQVADGRGSLQIWRIAVNILN